MAVSKVVPVRLSDETIARIEAHGERLRAQTGLDPSRSDVVKLLIERGLASVEAEIAGPVRRAPRSR